MNDQQIIDLINQWIVENHNNEITANVLNPILIAMVQQPNLLIGDLGDLATEENDNLVDAINWILTQISNGSITIHTGQNNPNDTPPASYTVGDFYSQLDVMNNPLNLWQYTGTDWARISNYIDDNSISPDTTWSSQKISEAIQGDRFTQLGALTWDENQVTASIGFEWVISGGQYLLTSDWQNTIPYTSALGFSRKDIIVAVQGNSFARIQGEEGTGIVEAPQLPPNTLLVSEFDVYHDSIGEPISPILGNAYVRKSKWFEIEEVGDDEPITTLTEHERHFIINGYTGTGDVHGFILSYPTDVYYDMVVSIWNRSGATLPLPHDDTQGGFYFPNGETYNLPDNAVVTFRLDNSLRLIPISVYPNKDEDSQNLEEVLAIGDRGLASPNWSLGVGIPPIARVPNAPGFNKLYDLYREKWGEYEISPLVILPLTPNAPVNTEVKVWNNNENHKFEIQAGNNVVLYPENVILEPYEIACIKHIKTEEGVFHYSVTKQVSISIDNEPGIFNRVVNIPFSEFGDDWENVTKENIAEKINDLEITQAQNEVYYFVVDDSVTPPPVQYNFDVEFEDVSDVVSYDFNEQSDFEQFLNDSGFVIYNVSEYTVTDNRVQCNVNIEDDLENFEFYIPEIGIAKIIDFSFIENIYGIDSSIVLTDNQINDVSGLASLSGLVNLNLSGNQISDLTGLSGLSNLKELDLMGNHISDISELGSLTNLTWLRLDNNQISDLTGLSNLISLNELSLNYNEITSLGWDSGLYWAENVAPIGGVISTTGNTNPITGTDFETALVNKSWTIIT